MSRNEVSARDLPEYAGVGNDELARRAARGDGVAAEILVAELRADIEILKTNESGHLERCNALTEEILRLRDAWTTCNEDRNRLRSVLEYYAEPDNYGHFGCDIDGGERARGALER